MKKESLKTVLSTSFLIVITFLAIGYTKMRENKIPELKYPDVVRLSGALTEEKIFTKGDGRFGFSLVLDADNVLKNVCPDERNVDMVIVLDQSGSMSGKKISDAKQAIIKLLSALSDQDRFGLVGYANYAQIHSGLVNVTPANRNHLESIVRSIQPDGGTNLGEGLNQGLRMLETSHPAGNTAKIMLVSDGLANQGITDPQKLTQMAENAARKEFPVCAVGVGTDFNEMLMTGIADRGMGGYYFLETPDSFFQVFSKEFYNSKRIVASSIEIRIPLSDDVILESAGGYPVTLKNGYASFCPGELLSGATRRLFLQFRVPAQKERSFKISGIEASYRYKDKTWYSRLREDFSVYCVNDRDEALASINKNEWEQKVLQSDYSSLKEEVAFDIKRGKKQDALNKIDMYREKQQVVNAVVGSDMVSENLDKDLRSIEETVNDTFNGPQCEIEKKQKTYSKSLQFEAYKGKRDRK
ncbi:MAG: VWA domain-containing protein [Proteobacteria bacterium]|nr:VWA domain-containing protein [Pseudomonadota bacterium]